MLPLGRKEKETVANSSHPRYKNVLSGTVCVLFPGSIAVLLHLSETPDDALMQALLCALAGLALLRAGTGEWGQGPRDTPGRRAAESPSSPGDLAGSPGCDRHAAVQRRLDIMEETVEKTVEHLEAEVTGLLGLLEELASNLPTGPFSPKPDLLGDDGF